MNTKELNVEQKLADLEITLPDAPKSSGNYLLLNQVDDLLYISGITCKYNGEISHKGKVGKDLSVEEGYEASKITTLNHLRLIKDYLGGFEKINKIVKVLGFVNSAPGFVHQPYVINGASKFLEEVFRENGKHARSAIGTNELPFNIPVEIEIIVEVEQ